MAHYKALAEETSINFNTLQKWSIGSQMAEKGKKHDN